MENELTSIPCIFKAARSLINKVLLLTFETQELDEGTIGSTMSQIEKYGHLIFYPNDVKYSSENLEKLVDKPVAAFKSARTPSQKLRQLMWIYYTKLTGGDAGFEEYYAGQIGKLIQRWQEEINRLEENNVQT